MSNHTMKIPDAARLLGVTDRTIRNYIKKGLLSSNRVKRSKLLDPVEVEELRIDLQSSSQVLSRNDVIALKAKVRRLESHMEVVLRILDAKSSPLEISSAYGKELHSLASLHVRKGSWSVAEIKPWVEIFERIDENDFQTIADSVSDPRAWLVFLKLNVSMSSFIVTCAEYETSLELQTLHRLLSESRRRLRVSAFIYAESQNYLQTELDKYGILSSPSTGLDTIFSKILKT